MLLLSQSPELLGLQLHTWPVGWIGNQTQASNVAPPCRTSILAVHTTMARPKKIFLSNCSSPSTATGFVTSTYHFQKMKTKFFLHIMNSVPHQHGVKTSYKVTLGVINREV